MPHPDRRSPEHLRRKSEGGRVKHQGQHLNLLRGEAVPLTLATNEVEENVKLPVQIAYKPQTATDTLDVVSKRGLCAVQNAGDIHLTFSRNENQIKDVNILVIEKYENRLEGANLVRSEIRQGPPRLNDDGTVSHVFYAVADVSYRG